MLKKIFVLFAVGIITFILSRVTDLPLGVCLVFGVIVVSGVMLAYIHLQGDSTENRSKIFEYKWQAYPFDRAQRFSIEAENQESANQLAIEKFTKMFEKGYTVMKQFYPVIE